MSREILAWIKRGQKLERKDPDGFRAAIEKVGWLPKSPTATSKRSQQSDAQGDLDLGETKEQSRAKQRRRGDDGYRIEGKPFCVEGRMIVNHGSKVILKDENGRVVKLKVAGDTSHLDEAQPLVKISQARCAVPVSGAGSKKITVCDADDIQLVEGSNDADYP